MRETLLHTVALVGGFTKITKVIEWPLVACRRSLAKQNIRENGQRLATTDQRLVFVPLNRAPQAFFELNLRFISQMFFRA